MDKMKTNFLDPLVKSAGAQTSIRGPCVLTNVIELMKIICKAQLTSKALYVSCLRFRERSNKVMQHRKFQKSDCEVYMNTRSTCTYENVGAAKS